LLDLALYMGIQGGLLDVERPFASATQPKRWHWQHTHAGLALCNALGQAEILAANIA
jgi:hypothetical protein